MLCVYANYCGLRAPEGSSFTRLVDSHFCTAKSDERRKQRTLSSPEDSTLHTSFRNSLKICHLLKSEWVNLTKPHNPAWNNNIIKIFLYVSGHGAGMREELIKNYPDFGLTSREETSFVMFKVKNVIGMYRNGVATKRIMTRTPSGDNTAAVPASPSRVAEIPPNAENKPLSRC